jgi:S1-C subfamily serine protease/Tfp pilus assembly protein PilF
MTIILPDMKENVSQSILVDGCSVWSIIHGSCRAMDAKFRFCLSWICCVIVVIAMSGRLEAITPNEVFKLASKSILTVKAYDDKGKLLTSGSGVVLDREGGIVTNFHVIDGSSRVVVIYADKEYPATLKNVDRARDICSLTAQGLNALPVSLGKSSDIEIGSQVYAIGFPMGVGLTFSKGIASGLKATSDGHYIQFTAPISPGSSGGGLFDEEARLIGIPTFFVNQGQLLNFALPIEWVIDLPKRDVAKSTEDNGEHSDAGFHRKMVTLEQKEDWIAQIQLCERWTKEFPGSVRAWTLLGSAYANNGNFRKAVDAYRHVVQINPDSVQNWLELGLLYGKIGQRDKQIESYQQAVTNNPEHAVGWYKLAVAYQDADKFNDALAASQQVIRISPAHVSAWMTQGYSFGKLGQKDKEIEAYLHAINIDQHSTDAYVCLGVAYSKAHREDDEVASYQQALHIKPDKSSALFNLGHYYMDHGNREKGTAYYYRLRAVDPELAGKFYDDFTYRILPLNFRE